MSPGFTPRPSLSAYVGRSAVFKLLAVSPEPEELGPVPPSAGRLLAKDAIAPSRGQRRHLRRGVLLVGGHASVPDQHCKTVLPITLIQQYRFATPNPLQTCKWWIVAQPFVSATPSGCGF